MSQPPPPTPAEAAAALRWLADAGADTLAGDEPAGWLKPPPPLPSAPSGEGDTPSPLLPPREGSRASAEPGPANSAPRLSLGAQDAGTPSTSSHITARTLGDLRAEAEAMTGLAIKLPNARLVFSDGNPESSVMIVGEAPGAEEERQGTPFVGPAGKLLDKMLAAIGLDRTAVYITNLSLWRPPANRTPSVQESAELLPLLHRHIAIVQPRLLLAVGGASAKALLQTPTGIMRLRGTWREIEVEGETYPLLPTFHPAYLLRSPEQKRHAWADLLALQARLKETG